MNITRITLITIVFFGLIFMSALDQGYAGLDQHPDCDISVAFDVDQSSVSGIYRVSITAGKEVLFRRGPLSIKGIKINGLEAEFDPRQELFEFVPDQDGAIEIVYEGVFRDSPALRRSDGIASNAIDSRGISLTGFWYPALEGLCNYNVKALLPRGYEAVSEAEEILKTQTESGTEFNFTFPHPVDGVSFIAADRYRVIEDSFEGIELAAYFFKEDLGLARVYLEYAKQYLELYIKLVGEYPYKRFMVVENFLPTGYSMPTFTLLGSSVVRLPFIVETSLGHEILHQWFGNHVYIDHARGNWAEGLTAYLSDHLYRERKGEGWQYRKQIMIKYASFVGPDNDFPAREFTGRYDRRSQAIGYGKVAMMFHMLRRDFGDERFFLALKDFIRDNRYSKASWPEVRASFQKYFDGNLHGFFTEWLDRTGLPELEFGSVELIQRGIKYELTFDVLQKGDVFALDIPLSIYVQGNVIKKAIRIESEKKSYKFVLPDRPDRIVFDEDYDVGRQIANSEYPPVVSRLLGAEELLIVTPVEGASAYKAVTDKFDGNTTSILPPEEVDNSHIKASSVIILGRDNPLIKRIFGEYRPVETGFHLEVRKNPWNDEKVIALVHSSSAEESEKAVQKIVHYGKYSTLHFENGVNSVKETGLSDRGVVFGLYSEPEALDLTSTTMLSNVIDGVSDKSIIYVGETHDEFSHHVIQLDVISGLYERNENIAIGMEMFQRPYQEKLDSYIAGQMDEKEFLRDAEYFKQWGFDYNLYKPILDFARAEHIPVIALNTNRDIVTKVSASGLESLSEEEQQELPDRMDFSDEEYRKRLEFVFSQHQSDEERQFDFFYEAQVLWDETMSMSISEYLEREPESQVVVIAGRGHLEYGSGIPKRTYDRTGRSYSIVLVDADIREGIADYIVFSKPVKGAKAPRLMVFISQDDEKITIAGFPAHSVSEEAGVKKGDVLLAVDDVEVSTVDDIKVHLHFKDKGEKVKLRIFRPFETEDTKEEDEESGREVDGEEIIIEVTL